MPQEKRLLQPLTPKLDRETQGVNCLLVSANERSAEVYSLQIVFFGLEVGDLADVVAAKRSLVDVEGLGGKGDGTYLIA
jgi:hypothetical protein